MKIWTVLLVGVSLSSVVAAAEKEHRYRMSLADEFVVAPNDSWVVEEEQFGYMPLRFANVKITLSKGADFFLDALLQVRYAGPGSIRHD